MTKYVRRIGSIERRTVSNGVRAIENIGKYIERRDVRVIGNIEKRTVKVGGSMTGNITYCTHEAKLGLDVEA